MTFILFYMIIALVILAVFETLKHDQPRLIMKRVLVNFGILTVILGTACFILYLIGL